MPSPFPGMDPYLEGPVWPDFHNSFLVSLRAALSTQLLPRYFVSVEQRVVLEPLQGDEPRVVVADLGIARDEPSVVTAGARAAAVVLEPAVLPQPRFLKVRHLFLHVLDAESRDVVTVIELLSPTNKAPGERNDYLAKRDYLLDVGVNLLEIDLLRGGKRIPTSEPLPNGDYYAFLSRASRRAEVSVFSWTMRDRLPTLPVPLREGDPDATADLQAAFERTFDEGGFGYRLRYGQPLMPAPPTPIADWISERLRNHVRR